MFLHGENGYYDWNWYDICCIDCACTVYHIQYAICETKEFMRRLWADEPCYDDFGHHANSIDVSLCPRDDSSHYVL